MAGNFTTPGAVKRALFSNKVLIGPLSDIVMSHADALSGQTPIKAIWRSDVGPASYSPHELAPKQASS